MYLPLKNVYSPRILLDVRTRVQCLLIQPFSTTFSVIVCFCRHRSGISIDIIIIYIRSPTYNRERRDAALVVLSEDLGNLYMVHSIKMHTKCISYFYYKIDIVYHTSFSYFQIRVKNI